MVSGELITISGFLDYLYSRFAVTYIMCFLGVIISKVLRITVSSKQKDPPHMSAISIALQGALVTVIICAAQDYLKIKSFNLYVLICVFAGVWSPVIVQCITNLKIVKMLIVNITKKMKDPFISAVGETIDQMDEDSKDKDEKKEEQSKENPQGGGT